MQNAEATLEHARFGITNAQETIRFIDAKIAVILSFLTFLVGQALTLADEIGLRELVRGDGCTWSRLLALLAVAVPVGALLVCLVKTACYCLDALTARPPEAGLARLTSCVLFPFLPDKGGNRRRGDAAVIELARIQSFRESFAKVSAGMENEEIAAEFADQCGVLGVILGKKMRACNRAIVWLLLSALALVLMHLVQ